MIPSRVLEFVKQQLATLAVLTRARQTDERLGGGGRYEAEAYENHRPAVNQAWKALSKFEALCGANEIDPQTVYAEWGRPARHSDAAIGWLTSRGIHVPQLAGDPAPCQYQSDRSRTRAPMIWASDRANRPDARGWPLGSDRQSGSRTISSTLARPATRFACERGGRSQRLNLSNE